MTDFASTSSDAGSLLDGEPIAEAMPAARRSRQARVAWGDNVVTVGGDAPVRVQSMTNTDTVQVIETAIQVKELALAGSELVRITVNTPEAAAAVPHIRDQLDRMGIAVPLVGDFHYNGHRLLTEYPACAEALSKYRINPGNVGRGEKGDRQFAQMVEVACRHDKPVRIGVNWGSLDQELLKTLLDANAKRARPWELKQVMYEALVRSAIESAEAARDVGLAADQILLSCKMSAVQDLIAVYRALARRTDHALHLGLTEAGMGAKGTVASAAALSVLLQEHGHRRRRRDDALAAHARFGEAEMQRVVAAAREIGVDGDQVLHVRDLARQDDPLGRQSERFGLRRAFERRRDERFAHDRFGFRGARVARVVVHHARQQRLVEAAPVDADAHRLVVADRELDQRGELRIALAALATFPGLIRNLASASAHAGCSASSLWPLK